MKPHDLRARMKPVMMQDRELFQRYLQRFPSDICIYNFPFLLLWGERRAHRFCELDGHLLVSMQQEDGAIVWYQPIGPDPATLIREQLAPIEGFSWKNLDEKCAEALRISYNVCEEPLSYDYVYEVETLQKLPGKKYLSKRTYINSCRRKYNPEIVPLSSALSAECLRVYEEWVEGRAMTPSLEEEKFALRRTLETFDQMGYFGIGVRIAGVMEAFAIGLELTPSIVVEDYEKATKMYTGLYQFLLNSFAKSLPLQYKELNRCGADVPGLHAAKEEWGPSRYVRRYCLPPE